MSKKWKMSMFLRLVCDNVKTGRITAVTVHYANSRMRRIWRCFIKPPASFNQQGNTFLLEPNQPNESNHVTRLVPIKPAVFRTILIVWNSLYDNYKIQTYASFSHRPLASAIVPLLMEMLANSQDRFNLSPPLMIALYFACLNWISRCPLRAKNSA